MEEEIPQAGAGRVPELKTQRGQAMQCTGALLSLGAGLLNTEGLQQGNQPPQEAPGREALDNPC